MTSLKFFKYLTGLALMLCLMAVPVQAANAPDTSTPVSEKVSTDITGENPHGIPIQTYIPPNETESHTIYWAKGVNPPLMSHELENYGKPGYFYKMTDPAMPHLSQYVFTHEFDEENKFIPRGIYDINKTNHHRGDQQPLCYMATTINMLHWWIDQNADYIDEYVAGIKSGRFKQEDGLYNINQDSLWKTLRKPSPPIPVKTTEKTIYYMQSIPHDNLSKPELYKKYRTYTSGGWMDNVAAFFFNGYDPGIVPSTGEHSPNGPGKIPVPEKFEPTPLAGYFHPIFGKTPLATRHYDTSYSYLSKSFREWLLDERMIGISFYPMPNSEHAITVWGAEYDSHGNLCRIFVSDSDDETRYQLDKDNETALHQVDGKPILRTLYSYDVYRDTEKLEFLYDAVKGAQPLRIEASISEEDAVRGGYLSYQWYKADTENGEGKLLEGKTGASFEPYIGTKDAVEYYYCVVTTHKYGHHNSEARSPSFKIKTTSVPLTHAAKPKVNSFTVQGDPSQSNSSKPQITCKQWSESPKITVNASVSDGGTLTYQWFPVVNRVVDDKHPLGPPSDSPDFYPPTDQAGEFQYHVQVTNTKPDATGQKTVSYLEERKFVVIQVRAVKPPTFTVQFSNPGSQFIEQQSVLGGMSIETLPVPNHRQGYSFTGWYENGQKVSEPYQVKKNVILTAGWEAVVPRETEYLINEVTLQDGASADTVQVAVSITNLLAAQVDQLLVAAYDQHGRQLGISVQNLVSDASQLPNAGSRLNLDPISIRVSTAGDVHRVKVFLLSKDGKNTPLAAAVSVFKSPISGK